jgi:predicted pyridoxine 5'-phosphate oxidase superfamily flavin-nucleotide-binding protein
MHHVKWVDQSHVEPAGCVVGSALATPADNPLKIRGKQVTGLQAETELRTEPPGNLPRPQTSTRDACIPSLMNTTAETALGTTKHRGAFQNIRKNPRNTLENVSRRLEEFN